MTCAHQHQLVMRLHGGWCIIACATDGCPAWRYARTRGVEGDSPGGGGPKKAGVG